MGDPGTTLLFHTFQSFRPFSSRSWCDGKETIPHRSHRIDFMFLSHRPPPPSPPYPATESAAAFNRIINLLFKDFMASLTSIRIMLILCQACQTTDPKTCNYFVLNTTWNEIFDKSFQFFYHLNNALNWILPAQMSSLWDPSKMELSAKFLLKRMVQWVISLHTRAPKHDPPFNLNQPASHLNQKRHLLLWS